MIILVIDDEKLARCRLLNLLSQIDEVKSVVEAASAIQALDMLQKIDAAYFDVVLLDIQMPGMDGLSFARALQTHAQPPAIVFVTAHPDYAFHAFDLAAADYLTKPVRLERLQQALRRACLLRQTTRIQSDAPPALGDTGAAAPAPAAAPFTPALGTQSPDSAAKFVTITERGRLERIPLGDILYCKAEQKYVTLYLHNATRSYDGALSELEAQHPDYFLRVHRNTLVAKQAIRSVEKASPEDGVQWVIHLHQNEAILPISRRLLSAVKTALRQPQ